AFAGDIDQTKEILKRAITHKGYALVDILQPCVTFNRENTYRWFKENTYYLPDSYNPLDRIIAFEKAIGRGKMALGVFYKNPGKKTFAEKTGVYMNDARPLFKRNEPRTEQLKKLMDTLKN
ncbi:MAG: 2-oxoacid ferredoxin oxidoreductase, partial [Candidatus Coatesbacteria bacterium]|nr:2-oxoacid ferredoxin oxidoreductase [Candidatus Coatesbacteria bacterium]